MCGQDRRRGAGPPPQLCTQACPRVCMEGVSGPEKKVDSMVNYLCQQKHPGMEDSWGWGIQEDPGDPHPPG